MVETHSAGGVFTFSDGSLQFTAGHTYEMSTAIDGSNHRYLLPEDFVGNMTRSITFDLPAGSPGWVLREVSEDRIRAIRAGGTTASGEPIYYAIRPILYQERPRWELILWPDPGTLRTVDYRYRRFPLPMVEGTEVPITGPQHDLTLLAACRARAELTRFDRVGIEARQYERWLSKSVEIDNLARPRNLGQLRGEPGARIAYVHGLVESVNGIPIDPPTV